MATEIVPKIDDILAQLRQPKKRIDLDQVIRQLEEIKGLTAPTTGIAEAGSDADDMGMADFFDDVANSLVTAQGNLNQQSLEYVRQLGPGIPPTFFAIPSLKAEMKVGFTKASGKGLKLILFSKSEERSQYGESTVTFEVNAAPPTPGEITAGELIVPPPGFLVIGRKRTDLLDAVLDLAEKATGSQLALAQKYENTKTQALVVRRTAAGETPSRYLVFWPARAKGAGVLAELSVFGLVDEGGAIGVDREFFESGLPFLTVSKIPDLLGLNANSTRWVKSFMARETDALTKLAAEHGTALQGKSPQELAELAIRLAAMVRDLGHAVDLAVGAVEGWQATVRRPVAEG